MKFNLKKGVLFGVLVWVVMFIVICILIAYKMPENIWATIITMVASLIAVYFCAKNLAPKSFMEALEYGVVFAIVGIILDLLISRMFAPDIFSTVSYWASYLLIILVPLSTVKKIIAELQNIPQNPQ